MDKINHWSLNRSGVVYDSEELSVLNLVGKVTNKTNEVVDKINVLTKDNDKLKNDKVSHIEMEEKYKLTNYGNFTGSWWGIDKPQHADVGISGVVDKLLETSPINPTHEGCKCDGKTDDTIPLRNAFLKAQNKILSFPQGATLYLTDYVDVENCIIFGNNVTLKFYMNGNKQCFRIKNNVTILGNINIDVIVIQAFTGDDQRQCPVVIGDYESGVGYSNIKIDSLTLSSERLNGDLVFVTGNSHDIYIDKIICGDSDKIGRVFVAHWGGSTSPTTRTTHPHNVIVNQIKTGKLTYNNDNQAVVFLSGVYNFKFNQIDCEETKKACIHVYPGDHGFKYATDEEIKVANSNIIFSNVVCKKSSFWGVRVNGRSNTTDTDYDMNVVIEDSLFVGNGDSTTVGGGIATTNCKGVILNRVNVTRHKFGVHTESNTKGLLVMDCNIYNNTHQGYYIGDSQIVVEDVKIIRGHVYLNGQYATTTGKSGISINQAIRTKIYDVKIGDKNNELYQMYGIRVNDTAIDTEIYDCYCFNINSESGASAYSLGSSSSYSAIKMFKNNTAKSNITLNSGLTIIPIDYKLNGARLFVGGIATSGTWVVGDEILQTPTVGGYCSRICVTSGTPGTWGSYGKIE